MTWLLISSVVFALPLVLYLGWCAAEAVCDIVRDAIYGDSDARLSVCGILFTIGLVLFFTYCGISSYGTYWGKDLKNPKQPIEIRFVEKEDG